MRVTSTARIATVVIALASCADAAPRLRFLLDSFDLGTMYVGLGQNLSPIQIDVENIGDGQLKLTVSSSAPWVSATSGCAATPPLCIIATFDTASLSAGLHTAVLTVSDPNALDTPQNLTLGVWVGSTVPSQLNLYAPPGQSVSVNFSVDTIGSGSLGVATSVDWLAVSAEYLGPPILSPWATLSVSTSAGLEVGEHQGSFTLSNSLYDDGTVNVDLDVTMDPIADTLISGDLPVPNPSVTFTASLPLGPNAAETQFYRMQNDGLGQLVISGIAISPEAAAWLSATPIAVPGSGWSGVGIGAGVAITANPQSLPAGTYNGTVTLNSNAANSPVVIPVELDVMARGTPPAIIWPQILNIANFTEYEPVSPGDIVAIFGVGLLEGDPVTFSTPPLPTQAGTGNTQVFVNGRAAPIFYASYDQINIQIPFEILPEVDAHIQVMRDGMLSPMVTVPTALYAPQILSFGCPYANDCDPLGYRIYAIGLNASDGSFPLPTFAPFPNRLLK